MNHQRVIHSFELIGATALVDPLNASRRCETRPEDRYDYTETAMGASSGHGRSEA